MTTTTATTEKLVLAHEDWMSEKKIEYKDLPKDLKGKINGLKLQISKYKNKPTDNLKEAITRQSIQIADDIENWSDQQIKGDDNADDGQNKDGLPAPKGKIPGTVGSEPDADFDDTELKKILERDGKIYHTDLKKMLGKKNLEDKFTIKGTKLERSVAFYYKVE